MDTITTAYISAGSNLGDSLATLRGAMQSLGGISGVRVAAISSFYETDPVGGVPQPAFLNVAARLAVASTLSPEALLREMQRIESVFGRRRENEIHWGPRTLDLDLLLFGNEARATDFLTLPHPRMWQRAFVLVPLHEVADAALRAKLQVFPKSDPSVRRVNA